MKMEVLADPAALAHCVAEWMTSLAQESKGPFRVSLSGGSTPKALYALLASAIVSRGIASPGTGATSASFPTIIRRATTG